MVRALVLTGRHTLEVRDRAPRHLRAGEVRLRVDAAGICGSDIHGFAGVNDRRPVGVVMGHETIGTVIEMTSETGLTIGERVAVNPIVVCGDCPQCRAGSVNLCLRRRLYGCSLDLDGGLADEMVVAAGNCVPVDTSANLAGLTLIEPMAVGTHAVRLVDIGADSRLLVVGGGPIGIAVAMACAGRGANPLVCEPRPERRALVQSLGPDACSPEDLAAAEGSFDIAFECVGSSVTLRSAVTSVQAGGVVVVLGLAEPEIAVSAEMLVIQERSLLGSSAYTTDDFRETARWVTGKADGLAQLVELTVDLPNMPRVFADYHAGRLTAMKTLYFPSRKYDQS